MSTPHRPSDETLAAFATGRLDEGLALVVAAHLELNRDGRRELQDFMAIQGELLERTEPVPMASARPPETLEPAIPRPAAASIEAGMPTVLRPYALGPWRPIGLRIAMRRVEVPGAGARVFMLRAGPGMSLPPHKHTGFEWTTILAGAYEHEYGRYVAGDFDEAGAGHDHTPNVDPVEGCTCIVAMTGKVLLQGWLGRLLQPLVRF